MYAQEGSSSPLWHLWTKNNVSPVFIAPLSYLRKVVENFPAEEDVVLAVLEKSDPSQCKPRIGCQSCSLVAKSFFASCVGRGLSNIRYRRETASQTHTLWLIIGTGATEIFPLLGRNYWGQQGGHSKWVVQIPKLTFRLRPSPFPSLSTVVTHLLTGNLDGNIFRYSNRKYAKIQPLLIWKFCEGPVLSGSKLCICLRGREKEQMTWKLLKLWHMYKVIFLLIK